METFFGVNRKKLQRQYKKHLNSFNKWALAQYVHQWIIYPENIETHLSIDEVALSQGKLYTILTNKKFQGKNDSIVAIVTGTKVDQVIERICKID
ncbi:hypothetical protein DBR27_24760 [Flavobacterium sp. HMWF030]|nr:hypothetical protein DBR27_24760 [Flavobacterium sp. HMWF030]